MPLGNLTSQFFANVYLNELDYYIKHKLKAKYYGRYVDDFIILHQSKEQLIEWKNKIQEFLKNNLKLELHSDKSKIISLSRGIEFLGFRNFNHHRILKKNKRKLLKTKLKEILNGYRETNNYNRTIKRIEAIFAHLETADTFNLRKSIVNKISNKIDSVKYIF